MPLPSLLCCVFATGLVVAFAGRTEVATAGDRWWSSETFSVFAVFMGLVVVPVASYFYGFHGDWFLLYLASTASVISPLGLCTLGLVLATAVVGFATGVKLCRLDDMRQLRVASAGALGAAIALFLIAWPRVTVVGSTVQFEKQFGLSPYWGSAASWGGLWMALVLIGAVGYLYVTLQRRYHRN